MATAAATTPKRPAALVETRLDASGLTVTLPKASRAALCKARDVCAAIEQAVPTLKAQGRGLKEALSRLLRDVSGSPMQVECDTELSDDELRELGESSI